MSHLPEALERMSSNDPTLRRIDRVPVSTVVTYHGRVGAMRQGRNEFPAFVLKQHPDDGSLDLIVFFEAEDMIWEQRVLPWSETQPGHSWSHVEAVTDASDEMIQKAIEDAHAAVERVEANRDTAVERIRLMCASIQKQMYGDYNPPEKSMIEYLDDFDMRLSKLEAKLRK